jgi:hypothetical protein
MDWVRQSTTWSLVSHAAKGSGPEESQNAPPGHFPNFGLKPNFRIWPAGKIALNQSFLSQLQGVRLWHRHCLSLTGIESLAG